VFQREIRKFFEWFSLPGKNFARRNKNRTEEVIGMVRDAVKILTKSKTGALIVFEGNTPIEGFVAGGFRLDGRVSVPVLLSIFDTSSPGHDGAIIISENRIRYFGAHLPLAENFTQIHERGTRHRAAVGISEDTDALTIVVSEERGATSIALHGKLEEVTIDELEIAVRTFLTQESNTPDLGKQEFWHDLLVYNWIEKALSIIIAIILWIALLN
jgi:DNA integrity scanning protein DisA with diadenylate cyclase activity